jgi:hypothetical protein
MERIASSAGRRRQKSGRKKELGTEKEAYGYFR